MNTSPPSPPPPLFQHRIALTRRLPRVVEREFAAQFEVETNEADVPYDDDDLAALLRRADAIVSTVTDRFDTSLFSASDIRTKVIANFGVGYDNIDVAAARGRGIVVTNTPDVLTEDTADLAVALMLAVARRLGEGERLVRGGAWSGWTPTQLLGTRVWGKTLGIIGWGRIGRAVARRAFRGFGMTILCASRRPPVAATVAEAGARVVEVDELLGESDIVSLHTPATPATRHLIDARRLALLQHHAVLVNTSRGEVVDERALITALETGQLAGAGLDVYQREPEVSPALLRMENVVLLPHLGSATVETRVAMGRRALENVRAFFEGLPVPDPVP